LEGWGSSVVGEVAVVVGEGIGEEGGSLDLISVISSLSIFTNNVRVSIFLESVAITAWFDGPMVARAVFFSWTSGLS